MANVVFVQETPIPRSGVMQLAACLKQAGHPCFALVASLERDLVAATRRLKPDLIGISCNTGEHSRAIAMIATLRSHIPGIPVIMGGPHASAWPQVVEHPVIDMICRGEGERALVHVADCLDSGDSIADIPNLGFATDKGIRLNPLGPLVSDLDSLPFPDKEIYARYERFGLGLSYAVVLTGRGCPFDCSFCVNGFYRTLYGVSSGVYVRRRKPENVITEIEAMRRNRKIRTVEFIDDTFTLQIQWLNAFLPLYKERIGLPFACDTRADLISQETAHALRDAGCHTVRLSVESGNDFLRQQVLRKDLTKETIARASRRIRCAGMKLLTYNIIGSPEETVDHALETLSFNRTIKPNHALCTTLQVYPQTALWTELAGTGVLLGENDVDRFSESFYGGLSVRNADAAALESLQRLFYLFLKVPIPTRLVRRIVRIRPSRLHDWVFALSYAIYLLTIERLPILDLVRVGSRARQSILSRRTRTA